MGLRGCNTCCVRSNIIAACIRTSSAHSNIAACIRTSRSVKRGQYYSGVDVLRPSLEQDYYSLRRFQAQQTQQYCFTSSACSFPHHTQYRAQCGYPSTAQWCPLSLSKGTISSGRATRKMSTDTSSDDVHTVHSVAQREPDAAVVVATAQVTPTVRSFWLGILYLSLSLYCMHNIALDHHLSLMCQ